MKTPTITEADRATARRVIRRIAGVGPNARIDETILSNGKATMRVNRLSRPFVCVDVEALDAACLAAAQGRLYAAALRGAR